MINAIIIGHGQIADNCRFTLSKIIGGLDGCTVISNEGRSLSDLQECIDKSLSENEETIIFVDFFGSNLTAAKIAGKGSPIVCGFNIPMLISFFTKREKLPLNELLKTVIADGKRGISSQISLNPEKEHNLL